MEKANNLNSAVKKVFSEREKFIILGLTGRTGSGCSTTAKILAQEFQYFHAPMPKGDGDIDDRQYRITHTYLQKNWGKFYVIQAADIISSFILEHDFSNFIKMYSSHMGLKEEWVQDQIPSSFKDLFVERHQLRIEIRNRILDDESALRGSDIHEFNFAKLPNFTGHAKSCLEGVLKGSYVKFYQFIANNIRKSGKAYSTVFSPDSIFTLAQRVNSFVKQLRLRQKEEGGRVLVCIDAIRNPFEASFFRERYSAFYLVSVATDEEERRRRLRGKPFSYGDSTIDQIELKECPPKLSGEEYYFSQNVPECIEMADIHIYNPKDDSKAFREIKKQLIKYISLIMHPGLVQPTDVERCMQIAIDAKLNSGCVSRQVGAVITDKTYSVKAIGWNSTPEGQVPCSLRSINDLISVEDSLAFSDYERTNVSFMEKVKVIYKEEILGAADNGWPLSYCFKDIKNCIDEEKNQVHTKALHAEENAFLQITKYGGCWRLSKTA